MGRRVVRGAPSAGGETGGGGGWSVEGESARRRALHTRPPRARGSARSSSCSPPCRGLASILPRDIDEAATPVAALPRRSTVDERAHSTANHALARAIEKRSRGPPRTSHAVSSSRRTRAAPWRLIFIPRSFLSPFLPPLPRARARRAPRPRRARRSGRHAGGRSCTRTCTSTSTSSRSSPSGSTRCLLARRVRRRACRRVSRRGAAARHLAAAARSVFRAASCRVVSCLVVSCESAWGAARAIRLRSAIDAVARCLLRSGAAGGVGC